MGTSRRKMAPALTLNTHLSLTTTELITPTAMALSPLSQMHWTDLLPSSVHETPGKRAERVPRSCTAHCAKDDHASVSNVSGPSLPTHSKLKLAIPGKQADLSAITHALLYSDLICDSPLTESPLTETPLICTSPLIDSPVIDVKCALRLASQLAEFDQLQVQELAKQQTQEDEQLRLSALCAEFLRAEWRSSNIADPAVPSTTRRI